jgi:primosomal protein N' (replication factor Y)
VTEKTYIQVILPLRLEWEPVYYVPEGSSVVLGERVIVNFAGKTYTAVVSSTDAGKEAERMDAERIKPISGTAELLQPITKEEIELWRKVAGYYLCTVGEVYKAAYPDWKIAEEKVKARKALRKKNAEAPAEAKPEAEKITLTQAQNTAYSEILGIFDSGRPALLHGVTGSGKTEIYLRLAQETLAKGRNVLYLVPEIALSRQLEERIAKAFPSQLRIFHSAETISKRLDTTEFIRNNEYVLLGTRSAIFLPHRDLGLVIVDEENDTSYKQDNPAPRYNGRETAIMLAGIFKANVILGSATPSLESLYNCDVGRYGKVRLTQRYYDSPDSDVEIIDTIAERRKNGMVGDFSRKLIAHIQECLSRHEQVLLLRERRSYSPIVQCEECGDIPKCRNCNVTLSLNKRADGSERLVCHYCGRVYEYTGRCRKCGGEMKMIGAGTQKIEEEARELFPDAVIARLDSDSAKSSKEEKKIIKDFSEGKIDIIIGTQIVAKGFDFSGLTLVAVLKAESILGQEDFRADEHGLQLLEQFRGRSGRRGSKGLFVIQTSQPQHPVYQGIAGTIPEKDLADRLLEERKAFFYPPYSRVIGIIFKDYNLKRVELMAQLLGNFLRQNSGMTAQTRIIGPYAPRVDKISNQYFRQIRILLRKDKALSANKAALCSAIATFEKEKKYIGHISLDVDPS